MLGVVLIKGGNHKLCVELTDMLPVSRERVNEDIREFQRIYAKVHPACRPRASGTSRSTSSTFERESHIAFSFLFKK